MVSVQLRNRTESQPAELTQLVSNRALRGAVEWATEGLPEPRAVAEATAAYFDQQDVFGELIAADCQIGGTSQYEWESSADLYEAWCQFAEKARHRPGNQTAFAKRMQRLGLERDREKIKGKRQRVSRGIMLRREPRE